MLRKKALAIAKGQQLWSVFSLNKKLLPSREEAGLPDTRGVLCFDLQSLCSSARGKELHCITGFYSILHQEQIVFMSGSLKLHKGRNGPKYACVGSTKTSNIQLKGCLGDKTWLHRNWRESGPDAGKPSNLTGICCCITASVLKEILWRTETNAAFLWGNTDMSQEMPRNCTSTNPGEGSTWAVQVDPGHWSMYTYPGTALKG